MLCCDRRRTDGSTAGSTFQAVHLDLAVNTPCSWPSTTTTAMFLSFTQLPAHGKTPMWYSKKVTPGRGMRDRFRSRSGIRHLFTVQVAGCLESNAVPELCKRSQSSALSFEVIVVELDTV